VPTDAATKGGYARPLTPEEQAEQARMVAEHLKTQDIVVTTAQIPGRKAPRIITADMVKSMKPGAVVLDMAAESGGNVEGSKPGKTVTVGGVKLIGARNLPARIAPATTVLYAKNLMNFVQLLVDATTKELKIDTGDELIKGTLLTTGGAVVHDAFKPAA
jgi:H+-translocating NAD(P) transhydrogenase subunit alpha